MERKILSLFEKHKEGLDIGRIQSELNIKRKDKNRLLDVLKKMEKEKILRRTKRTFRLALKSSLRRGRFVSSLRGFGFVTPKEGGEDIFVPARYAEGVLEGDDVEVWVKEKGKFGKPEGKVVRILKRGRSTILGIYHERNRQPFLRAFDSPSAEDVALKSKGRFSPREGMIVEADRKSLDLIRVFGLPDDPGVDTQIIILRFGLESRFKDETLREAEKGRQEQIIEEDADRIDFRDWTTVTIDGEKAQDFDDAVSIKRIDNGNYLLGVHIADVSHYVRTGTNLDDEARTRGTSVYFPDLTLPMLPEALSNDICSLRPQQPRRAVTVLMEIDGQGSTVKTTFTPSLIQTVERMTYASVNKIFQGHAREKRKYAALLADLKMMRELAELLRKRRLEEGSLDFDLVEAELIYEAGKLLAVAGAERNEAHRLIEEFMVAANVAVALFLDRKNIPSISRIHPAPAPEKLEKLKTLLKHFGYNLPKTEEIRSHDLQRILEKAKGRPEEKFIGIQVLKAMKLAVYDERNTGHFGLAKKHYTHFTSPIRRYPDLIVHRILKAALAGRETGMPALNPLARYASERERKADEAERALLEWRIFRFLRNRLGETFPGIIVDITKAGLVVELEEYFVDGLLPYQALDGDYYARTTAKTLRGRRRGKTFDLGDRLQVILVACDPALQRMSFALDAETLRMLG